MKAKLYAHKINRREMTILDVPEDIREQVLGLLPDADRRRMEALLEGEE